MNSWSSVLGFLLGLAANKISERWTLYQAYGAARQLTGEWVAHDYDPADNRKIEPKAMAGAGLTLISAKPWWKTHSHVLDVHAQDLGNGRIRDHHGWIAIDPGRPWRATRTIFYDDSGEIEEQRILISGDGDTLYVVDESVDGGYSDKHVLRRRTSAANFILNSMAPVSIHSASTECPNPGPTPRARQDYSLALFVVSCFWLVVVTALLFLSGLSVLHVSDAVLIAATITIPLLFLILRLLVPGPTPRPVFVNCEHDPETGKYRVI